MTRLGDMESALPSQPASSHSDNSESRALLSTLNSNGSITGLRAPNPSRSHLWRAFSRERRILRNHAGRREPRNFEPSMPVHCTAVYTSTSHSATLGPYYLLEPQYMTGSNPEQIHERTHSPPRPETPGAGLRGFHGHPRSWSSILRRQNAKQRLIRLVVSAIFLVLAIAVYLAFAVSNGTWAHEIHIPLIFMILILGIIFCHSLIRFGMAIFQCPQSISNRVPSRAGPMGYAQPERPIHVTLAGDEEMAFERHSSAGEKVTVPPPAYGLWRSTVRLNPDLLYWQRVEKGADRTEDSSSGKNQMPRPPSYTSDDGITYVVEAQPRSLTLLRSLEDQR